VSIKAKQVAGVTTLVVVVVAALSAYHLATLARLSLQDTASRGQMLAQAVFQRAGAVVAQGGADPYAALRADGGIRSILESISAYSENVTYAAIVNTDQVAVAHSFASLEGEPMAAQEDFAPLAAARRPHENSREPERRLRVGYVSPDFREHPVARFILPLFREHDRQQVEVFAYSDVAGADSVTGMLRNRVDHVTQRKTPLWHDPVERFGVQRCG